MSSMDFGLDPDEVGGEPMAKINWSYYVREVDEFC